jgi:hypothetical protein
MISGSGQAFAVNDTQGSVGDVAALATYVGGLSGGSWAVASWLANDGVRPETLVREVSVPEAEGRRSGAREEKKPKRRAEGPERGRRSQSGGPQVRSEGGEGRG